MFAATSHQDTGRSHEGTTVDTEVFRHAVGHFASGVTVIATECDGALFGTTASAVSSLSMEPPMMLVCLNRSSRTHDAVIAAGRFAVNILTEDQGSVAKHFAGKHPDKFGRVAHAVTRHRLPVLTDALATIECVVADTAVGGTHTVFIGRVVDAAARDGEPLAYYRGTFGRLSGIKETAAYEGTRDWVLRRRAGSEEPIDVEALAAALRTSPVLVGNALIRLAAESLVVRRDDGGYVPAPMTAELIDHLYTARLTIETGVIDSHLAEFSDELISRIRATAELVRTQDTRSESALTDLLDLSLRFHAQIVSGAGSPQLTATYRQLQAQAIWRDSRVIDTELWRAGAVFVEEIAAAITARDTARAKRALRLGAEHARDAAVEAIATMGGAA